MDATSPSNTTLYLRLPSRKGQRHLMNLETTLRRRPAIGLDAIDAVALMDRFDSKHVVPKFWLESMIEALDQHRVLTIQDHATTTYHNLYFDSADDRCLYDHVRGRNVRHKVRIRHYENTGVSFLEVKLRDVHGKTTKHRVVRSPEAPWNAPLTDQESRFISNHIPNAEALQPALQSSFERFTLVDLGQGERITFDFDLKYCAPASAGGPAPWQHAIPDLAIVEWKQRRLNHQGSLMQAMRAQKGRRGHLGRPLRLSKFILGHSLVHPDKPVKGYRAALRAVERAQLYAENPTFVPQPLFR